MISADGRNLCDRCGVDVGNAGIDRALSVSDVTDSGEMVQLRFCRAEQSGCDKKVLSPRNLQYRLQQDAVLGISRTGKKPEPQPEPVVRNEEEGEADG